MPGPTSERLTAETLAEALHLALAARALDRHGLFAQLAGAPVTAADLAARTGLDSKLLVGVLTYLATRTTLVEQTPAGFASRVVDDPSAAFLLRLYADAFLPCSSGLTRMLAGGPPRPIDEAARGRAFAGAPAEASNVNAGVLHQLGFNRLLDLGCGSGALLATLASASLDFKGWGIEQNPRSCRVARSRLHDAMRHRVKIARGDVRQLATAIPAGWIEAVETIFIGDLLNEFMVDGGAAAIRWLTELAELLPGRTLVVSDYYGRLMGNREAPPLILLHDFVQLVSGQGIPPPDLTEWSHLYTAAGWQLIHAIEDQESNRFVHILKHPG